MVSVAELRESVNAAHQMTDIIFQHLAMVKEKSDELQGLCQAMLDTSAQEGAQIALAGLRLLNDKLEEAIAGPQQAKEGFTMISGTL
jgi:hypothetical protein